MESQKEHIESGNLERRWRWLFKFGGVVCWVLLVLFAVGITGVGSLNPKYASLQNNWLMLLFKLNVQSYYALSSMLNNLNYLDLTIMLMFCVLFLALLAALYRIYRVWSVILTTFPFLGIILFLCTHTAGRSALLIGVFIYSILMINNGFRNICAYSGITGSALLFFAGDIGTTLFPASIFIAICIGFGYLLWMVWFGMTGWRLFIMAGGK